MILYPTQIRPLTALLPTKKAIFYPLDDPHKTRWNYLSHSFPLKGHAPFGHYALLEVSLNESGYDQMQQIIDFKNYLLTVENNPYTKDSTKYYLAVNRSNHKDSLFAWTFEGYLICLNFAITPDEISFYPAFGFQS